MRKLFGNRRKGKRLLDKAVKQGRFVDEKIDKNRKFDKKLKKWDPNDKSIKEERPIVEKAREEHLVFENSYEELPVDATDNEDAPLRRDRNNKSPLSRRHIVYASMIVVGVFFAVAALRVILSDVIEDANARSEYDQLREGFPDISGQAEDGIEDEDGENAEQEIVLQDMSLDELAAINRDFIGWINANNNQIDYPVVRGRDNDRYINTTFFGSRNSAGAIFMDHRHSRGFDENVVILYGHHTRDGSMFTSLVSHLEPGHRSRNPDINILTRDGRRLTYRIFAAKLTDAWDPAYATVGTSDIASAIEAFPNAPANATRFLILSTCTRSNDDDERILVFAALG